MAYALPDSGAREHFDSGSRRDSREGKGRYDLLSPAAISWLAKQMEAGAVKYGDRNWELGQPLSRFVDSALRHSFAVLAGKTDECHAAAALWNWHAFLHTADAIRRGELPAELADIPLPFPPEEAFPHQEAVARLMGGHQ